MVKICRIIETKLNQLVYENIRIITTMLRNCGTVTKTSQWLPHFYHGGKTAGIV